jgi:hypothetical protein
VEGFKIRIEVESEGWRGRMEVLKNELQTLRREHECGMAEAKRSIQKEVKAKLGELMAAAACYCTRENEWREGTGSLSSSVRSFSFSTDRNIHLM